MLQRLLTCASRTLSEAYAHRCPIVALSARALDSDQVGGRAMGLGMQPSAGSAHSMAFSAFAAARQLPAQPGQQQLLHGATPGPQALLPVRASALRRHYTRLAAHDCASDGLQRASPATRHPAAFAHRPHFCGGSSSSGSPNRHRWQVPGQLSAAQNFSIWSGRPDRSQDDSFDR